VFDAINLNDQQFCPGAERCRAEKGPGNLWKYPEEEEERVCTGCKLIATKPESTPTRLALFAALSTELAELKTAGAAFAYPQALAPLEWAALTGLTRGREKADTLRDARERKTRRPNRNDNGRS
jgi:hypothetical protein